LSGNWAVTPRASTISTTSTSIPGAQRGAAKPPSPLLARSTLVHVRGIGPVDLSDAMPPLLKAAMAGLALKPALADDGAARRGSGASAEARAGGDALAGVPPSWWSPRWPVGGASRRGLRVADSGSQHSSPPHHDGERQPERAAPDSNEPAAEAELTSNRCSLGTAASSIGGAADGGGGEFLARPSERGRESKASSGPQQPTNAAKLAQIAQSALIKPTSAAQAEEDYLDKLMAETAPQPPLPLRARAARKLFAGESRSRADSGRGMAACSRARAPRALAAATAGPGAVRGVATTQP
jgi:hypothetical protein